MSDRLSRLFNLIPPLGLLLFTLVVGRSQLVAQDQKTPANNTGKELLKIYYGIRTCGGAGCHGEEKPRFDETDPQLCRFNELTSWEKHDKHADAYKVLLGERGRQMLKLLNIDLKVPSQARACLTCHGVIPEEGAKQVKFAVEEGVSCVICHGSYGEWVEKHISPLSKEEFRALSRKEKYLRFGMTDLWDPLTRSKLCVSCHIGNVAEGKVVTHDMYAAGHPPLPGFEMANFCKMMPAHWEETSKKDPRLQKLLGHDGKTQEQAKLVLVGAAVSLADYLHLVVAQVEQCKKEMDEEKKVLDWASFDCWSCHHDLKSPSWRQTRGYAGKPGRVPMKTWPAELVRVALDHLGEDKNEFEARWSKVQTAFVAKQFGDLDQILATARPLMEWSNQLAVRLNQSTVDRTTAEKLLVRLRQVPTTIPDYDSARQIGWAFEAIWKEHSPNRELPVAFKAMSAELGLELPLGRMGKDSDGVIVRELARHLKRINDYEPAAFLKQLRGLTSPSK